MHYTFNKTKDEVASKLISFKLHICSNCKTELSNEESSKREVKHLEADVLLKIVNAVRLLSVKFLSNLICIIKDLLPNVEVLSCTLWECECIRN